MIFPMDGYIRLYENGGMTIPCAKITHVVPELYITFYNVYKFLQSAIGNQIEYSTYIIIYIYVYAYIYTWETPIAYNRMIQDTVFVVGYPSDVEPVAWMESSSSSHGRALGIPDIPEPSACASP
jgi:hypothetical protein